MFRRRSKPQATAKTFLVETPLQIAQHKYARKRNCNNTPPCQCSQPKVLLWRTSVIPQKIHLAQDRITSDGGLGFICMHDAFIYAKRDENCDSCSMFVIFPVAFRIYQSFHIERETSHHHVDLFPWAPGHKLNELPKQTQACKNSAI